MQPIIKWNKQAEVKVAAAARRGLTRAAVALQVAVQKRISTSGRGETKTPGRYAKQPSPRNNRPPMPMNRSKPGQPPKSDTGHLRRSIGWSHAGEKATVFTTVKYGVVMELGKKKVKTIYPVRRKALCFAMNGQWVFAKKARPGRIKPRPYMVSTFKLKRKKLEAIVAAQIAKETGVTGAGITMGLE